MERNWQVVAVYQPLPRRDHPYAPEVIPPGAGTEFKFTVVRAADETQAVAAVMEHWLPWREIRKHFGFMAKEI